MPKFHKRLEGPSGKIEVEDLGLLIGKIVHWTLTRRADMGPDSEVFDLHAHLGMVNEAVFKKYIAELRVVVQFGKGAGGRSHLIVQEPEQRTVLQGRSLVMERVNTCLLEQ